MRNRHDPQFEFSLFSPVVTEMIHSLSLFSPVVCATDVIHSLSLVYLALLYA